MNETIAKNGVGRGYLSRLGNLGIVKIEPNYEKQTHEELTTYTNTDTFPDGY